MGAELLRFFYGFPVDSFDGVDYLFSVGVTRLTVSGELEVPSPWGSPLSPGTSPAAARFPHLLSA